MPLSAKSQTATLIEKNLDKSPSDIEFKYPWRTYQKRALEELKEHLDDNHMHIVAPPGSGKTVLGLEVAIRLNKPTLIFAPSLAIRNQWIQRFCELFLKVEKKPGWIISAVDNPRYLIIRKNLLFNILSQEDYHAVPERLGKNRILAEYFKNQWSRFVGSCELVYTRTLQGRKILLQSRLHSLASRV